VDQETWDAVQALLRQQRRTGGASQRNKWGALLRGLLRCGRCGAAMVHSFTQRGSRVHRYYICSTAEKQGAAACRGSRAPAGDLEQFVVDKIRAIGHDPKVIAETLAAAKRDLVARQPELIAEARRLTKERAGLADQRSHLLVKRHLLCELRRHPDLRRCRVVPDTVDHPMREVCGGEQARREVSNDDRDAERDGRSEHGGRPEEEGVRACVRRSRAKSFISATPLRSPADLHAWWTA
jgi:hypothetical protein